MNKKQRNHTLTSTIPFALDFMTFPRVRVDIACFVSVGGVDFCGEMKGCASNLVALGRMEGSRSKQRPRKFFKSGGRLLVCFGKGGA